MKTPRRIHSGSVGFDMTPMIDIVFQLIIFFLLTGHLVKQETQMELPLPTATTGEEEDDSDDSPRITLNVQQNGRLTLGSGELSATELPQRLRDKRADAGPNLEVRIRSDRRAPYRAVEPILLACTQAGIWNVTFAVFRSEEAAP